MLPVAVARSSSGGVAKFCGLPVDDVVYTGPGAESDVYNKSKAYS